MQLTDYLNSINNTKKNVIRDNEISREASEKLYLPFVVARTLSYFEDCILFVNELNLINTPEKIQHYEFLLHIIRQRKRFSRWSKAEKPTEIVQALTELYGYSETRAQEAAQLLKPSDVELILKRINKGGAPTKK